ncbi:uncharacterized protein LOC124171047 [Ischnura elegans]|uniref:uncharacterized protein LOC124171047 n=1 Tax=Ischnura elegans TaxID=197161 RepID=UPI001ED88CE4|nr:uncharacterized protein LOC124171047 [Ischnura elegans]
MKAKGKKKTTKKKTTGKKKFPQPLRFPKIRNNKKRKKKKKKLKEKKKTVAIDETPELQMPDQESIILINPSIIGENQDVMVLRLNEDAQAQLGCVIGKDLLIDNNWKYIEKDLIKNDIETKGLDSPFYPLHEMVTISPNKNTLVIFDKNLRAYYLFFSFSPLKHFKNLTEKQLTRLNWVRIGLQNQLRKVARFRSRKARLIARALIKQKVASGRERVRVICFGELEAMDVRRRKFLSVEAKDLVGGYMNNTSKLRASVLSLDMFDETQIDAEDKVEDEFDTESEEEPEWIKGVRDFNVQSFLGYSKLSLQTFPAGRSNKTTLRRAYRLMSRRRCVRLYGTSIQIENSCSERLSWQLEENRGICLCGDYYGGMMLVERLPCDCAGVIGYIMRYSDPFYFGYHYLESFEGYPTERNFILFDAEGMETVSCMAWHPVYTDVVAIAHRGFIITERRDYYHVYPGPDEDEILEYEPHPEHEIIEWKITRDDFQKMRIIYSDTEVRHLQYNMDYPTLLAASNTRGQIMIWDMNIYPVPETIFIDYMKSLFSSEVVPWFYIPPTIAYITIESCEVFSHRDEIYDMQWVPSNSRMLDVGTIDVSCKVRSGLIVTASGDGTVGIWDLQFVHPNMKDWRHRLRRAFFVSRDVHPFYQYDRTMQPIQFVLAFLNDDPIPVTAVSVNNMRQWVVPGVYETDFIEYKSMTVVLKRQRPIMHACITAGLANGHIIGMLPDTVNYEFKKGLENPDFYKELYLIPEGEEHMHYQCFKHEGMILCLKRSRFADDLILSVSQESLCIWKEQSKLYQERLKHMPWYHTVYSIHMHGAPLQPRIWPVWRRKVYRRRDWFMNAEWSPLIPTQFFVLLSNGEVEIYDIKVAEMPVLTMLMGANSIHQVLPLITTTRVKEIAFVEGETFYFFDMPKPLRIRDPKELNSLKRLADECAWKRYAYNVWRHRFDRDNADYVRRRVAEIKATFAKRRLDFVTRAYNLVYLRRAKAKRAMMPFIEDLYYEQVPAAWWEKYKNRAIKGYLKRKKDFLKWIIWDDVIDDLELEEERLARRLFGPHRCAYLPHERYDRELADILCEHYLREYFQLYWDIRFEQQHMYDHLYVENYEEDSAFALKSDYFSELYVPFSRERQTYYGILFEIVEYYEAQRVTDLRKEEIRWIGALKKYYDVLGWETPFMNYMSCVLKRELGKAKEYPKVVHESEVPDADPPMNRMWELWDLLDMGYVMPLFVENESIEIRREAIDVTEY